MYVMNNVMDKQIFIDNKSAITGLINIVNSNCIGILSGVIINIKMFKKIFLNFKLIIFSINNIIVIAIKIFGVTLVNARIINDVITNPPLIRLVTSIFVIKL